jgi:hypothetical protein
MIETFDPPVVDLEELRASDPPRGYGPRLSYPGAAR